MSELKHYIDDLKEVITMRDETIESLRAHIADLKAEVSAKGSEGIGHELACAQAIAEVRHPLQRQIADLTAKVEAAEKKIVVVTKQWQESINVHADIRESLQKQIATKDAALRKLADFLIHEADYCGIVKPNRFSKNAQLAEDAIEGKVEINIPSPSGARNENA